jgi:hypothetical protein
MGSLKWVPPGGPPRWVPKVFPKTRSTSGDPPCWSPKRGPTMGHPMNIPQAGSRKKFPPREDTNCGSTKDGFQSNIPQIVSKSCVRHRGFTKSSSPPLIPQGGSSMGVSLVGSLKGVSPIGIPHRLSFNGGPPWGSNDMVTQRGAPS